MLSAALTLLSTFGYLVLQPRKKSMRFNPIDEWWTKHVCLRVQKKVPEADIWAECLYRVTFALSDQQLGMGIAILAAGFKLLGEGTITVYHFSIVQDLAIFSSNTHLLSLLALWSALGSARKHDKLTRPDWHFRIPFVMKLRFFGMFVMWCLLITATWTTASREWDADWAACPVRCIPSGRNNLGGPPLAWAIATTCFLVLQYGPYFVMLDEAKLRRATLVQGRIRAFNNEVGTRLAGYVILLKIYDIIRCIAVCCWYWICSEFAELLESTVWFIANCYWVVGDRALDVYGDSALGKKEQAKENYWGFGQIVPLLLLMLPVMTFIATWHGRCHSAAYMDFAYFNSRNEGGKVQGRAGG
jgi:hypothetical protein